MSKPNEDNILKQKWRMFQKFVEDVDPRFIQQIIVPRMGYGTIGLPIDKVWCGRHDGFKYVRLDLRWFVPKKLESTAQRTMEDKQRGGVYTVLGKESDPEWSEELPVETGRYDQCFYVKHDTTTSMQSFRDSDPSNMVPFSRPCASPRWAHDSETHEFEGPTE